MRVRNGSGEINGNRGAQSCAPVGGLCFHHYIYDSPAVLTEKVNNQLLNTGIYTSCMSGFFLYVFLYNKTSVLHNPLALYFGVELKYLLL